VQIARITRHVAFCCVLLLGAPAPWIFADDATAPRDASAPGVFFDAGQSDRLLEEVEACRAQLPLLRELAAKDEQLDEIRIEREALLRERIAFLERQQTELLRMNDQAIRQAELARKTSGGAWWEQALAAGKWIGLGILLGFAGAAGR
jgi:hypothetical protein